MLQLANLDSILGITIVTSMILGVWEMIWKGIGLWHASKDSRKGWFIAILVFNTIGILPIIYIYIIRKKKKGGKK